MIETCGPTGTTFDTVLHLRRGTCTAGAEIGCNDDTAGCGTTTDPGNPHRGSRLTPIVTAGQTYFIVVDGYSGRQGSFVLRVEPPTPQAACQDATVVPPEGGTFAGETSGTSTLGGICGASDTSPERVFVWTPESSGIAAIETCGGSTNYDTVLYVRRDSCDGTEVACNDDSAGCGVADGSRNASRHGSHLSLPVTAGQTYYLVVDGYAGRQGSFTLTVNPPTSACEAPTVIPPEGGTVHGTTGGENTLAGSCGISGNSPERVFAWTPAVSGRASIQTCSAVDTTFDTVLYLRRDSCETGTEIACNDDTGGCGTTTDPGNPHRGSRLTPTVEAGRTYFIVVDGYAGRRGDFALDVQAPKSGQGCDAPTTVPPEGGTFPGTTIGRSALAGSCGASDKSPEQVFTWTPARSGIATFQTCSATGTSYDTVVYVRGGSCEAGPELACNDDTPRCGTQIDPNNPHLGSRVSTPVVAGQTYFIVVDGFGGRAGDFLLEVTSPQ